MTCDELVRVIVNALPQILAALAFLWGVIQYFRAEKDKRETRKLEARKPFLELQLMLYAEVCHLAALIASSADDEGNEQKFYEMFWGRMPLVEDKAVERAMVEFENALQSTRGQLELQKLSLKLAHSCRNSLSRSWVTEIWDSHYLADAFEKNSKAEAPAKKSTK